MTYNGNRQIYTECLKCMLDEWTIVWSSNPSFTNNQIVCKNHVGGPQDSKLRV